MDAVELEVVAKDVYDLKDKIVFDGRKRILINTESNKNLLQLARKDKELHEKYKELLANDYVLYFHQKGISKFYKREHVGELFQRKDLKQHKGVFYTLDNPVGRKLNTQTEKKLIVIFSCMPDAKRYDSALMPNRMFPMFFKGIERNLVKNLYTMRVMDLNCSHGSHYISTTNYPDFELDIQNAIKKVKEELGIEDKNIVLYGFSKGATGAIFHASAMDLKCLAVDPILSIGGELEQNDRRFLKGLRRENIVPDINENLEVSNNQKKFVICSELVEKYYEYSNTLTKDKVNLINVLDDHIKYHPDISRNTVPEQFAIINNLFSENTY
ncbi:hypothetical protein BUZ94_08420 [Mammaliicoccus sciuri]|uniref:accessory Sec system protein Asp2 n=1 Tax=Mammaliicoccus sciuri TaxID=1296 RepID=UPI000E686F59|nr:accessory Sec system protein Asp2 [Mammaliicoccus sciuri]MEB6215592.1 XcbB/CpsF family capsular polysaccharide biosynthesis protein [Mammaliicoccus sciuri]MEB6330707.1 XcbB/CpsF family capsular polysaccharide biosynthesis protein [Mammaliicoccus sciuri]RIO09324.1 hypothetical protein BUZ94_08420 [Mammaliicoccus sciuri]